MTIRKIEELTGIEGLAKAIILQACVDYQKVKRRGKFKEEGSRPTLDELMLFFRGKWFGMLTEIPPERILKKLDGEL